MSEDKPRGPGRPKLYKPVREGEGAKHGAPYLGLRLDPPVYDHIKSRPEGPRAYVQRLVTEDIERTGQRGETSKEWESGGMMGQAQVEGEMSTIQAASKKAHDDLQKLIDDGDCLVFDCDPSKHGDGPFGRR